MEVIIASDRAGFKLKERIKKYLARPFFSFCQNKEDYKHLVAYSF